MFLARGCVVCADEVPAGGDPICTRCAGQLVVRHEPAGAPQRAAVELDPTARQVVAALKYGRERRLAAWIADRMLRCIPSGADLVTWAPATPARRRSRGFDQSHEIARAVGRRLDIDVVETLRRARRDTRQTGRSRADRAIGPDVRVTRSVAGLVVVIDDVVTTGATLDTCARRLRSAGADQVVAIAFAATRAHASPASTMSDRRAVNL